MQELGPFYMKIKIIENNQNIFRRKLLNLLLEIKLAQDQRSNMDWLNVLFTELYILKHFPN